VCITIAIDIKDIQTKSEMKYLEAILKRFLLIGNSVGVGDFFVVYWYQLWDSAFPGPNVMKLFTSVIYGFSYKLVFVPDRFVAKASNPSLSVTSKSALLEQTLALPTNIRLGWKGLPGTNTSLF